MHVKRHTRLLLRRRIGGLACVVVLSGVAAWQYTVNFQCAPTPRRTGPEAVKQSLCKCDSVSWQQHLRALKRDKWLYFDFSSYDLHQARLARSQFRGDRFVNCLLNSASLEGSRFVDAVLEQCEARDVDFSGCEFRDVVIQDSDLQRSDFHNASFGDGTVFLNCDLRGSRFEGATLGPGAITLVDCDMCDVDFRHVTVSENTFLRLVPSAMWNLKGHATVLPPKSLPLWQRWYGYACGVRFHDTQAKRCPSSLQPLRQHVQPAAAAKSLHSDFFTLGRGNADN
eukprot:GGOE01061331.1.p1 GENE.GGOE01061331.1~~GGOE01061331.1.p1  ORF type:complete len:283 (-),score=45.63 GGOE01061331.1:170-1018(-)